jgi:hypothetical protein
METAAFVVLCFIALELLVLIGIGLTLIISTDVLAQGLGLESGAEQKPPFPYKWVKGSKPSI